MMDILADDYCEIDENGNYIIKASVQNEMNNEPQSPMLNEPPKVGTGRWTPREHELFLEALLTYGKEWDIIEKHIGTRTAINCRSHAQKFFFKLVKYLEGDTSIEEIKHAEQYLEILQRKIEKTTKNKL